MCSSYESCFQQQYVRCAKNNMLSGAVMCDGAWLLNAGANQVKISEVSGIERMLIAMKCHEASAAVQENGCGALRNLAFNNSMWVVQITTC